MRKRNAITAAAATSLTFGGAATAVVNAHQNVAVASGAEAADHTAGRGVAVPSKPRVVTVYVDDPTTTVAGAPTPVTAVKIRVRGHASPGSVPQDPSSPPTAVPPRTAPHPKASPPAGVSAPKEHDDPPTTSEHDDTTTTEAPVATTVPPVTTTTAASGHLGDDD